MKSKKRKHIGLCAALAVVLFMTGCGAASGQGMMTEEAAAYDTASYVTDDVYMNESAAAAAEEPEMEGSSSGTPRVQESERKLIRNVTLNVETETFDDLMQAVIEKTDSFGGYIEESNTYNGSNYYGRGNRNSSLILRIPSERLDEFLGTVAEISNVVSRNESVTDVTLQYVDMKSHKEALVTEQTRLLELLEKAESVEDIITIESRLSDVRYQIESMESQLRTMDNQVSYSTVYLYIDEVTRLTPVKEQSTFEKMKTGFVQSLYNIGNGAKNLVISLIINLPYLVLWAVVIVIVVLLFRRIRRYGFRITKRKRKEQKEDQKEEKNE